MGSYAQLTVGDLEVMHFKNEVEPWIALAFTASDRTTRSASIREIEDCDDDEPWEITELVATADVIRDRLDLTGADWQAATAAFDELIREKIEITESVALNIHDEAIQERIKQEIAYLSALDLHGWVDALRLSAPDPPGANRLELGTRRWLMDIWEYGDIRLCLRAAIECRPNGLVTLNVTDLVHGGWLLEDEDPRETALAAFGWAERYASPIVVLTEGPTDAKALEAALEIIYPHLRGFIRFADFSHQPEANAAALAKTVKAFAAAGITNRVVALFDADSAARDAVRVLDSERLPPSIQVRHLPPIELAHEYPTIGPSGATVADDITGRACSIELYFGRDVLTDPSGKLRPIRWKSFIQGVNSWQGEIEGKREIQDRFWAKVREAMEHQANAANQDWSGMRAVIDQVRFAFTESRGHWAVPPTERAAEASAPGTR